MVQHILISSYSNDITTLGFDPSGGSLAIVSSTTVGHHPSWITFYPGDHSLVFTGLEQSDGKVIVLKYDQDGKGTVVAEAPSGGADPCSLLATKNELFVANYSAGVVAKFPISPNAPYLLSPSPAATIQLSGSGPNASRQEGPHPHQVFLHESYGEILVPDLGSDIVHRFKSTESGLQSHGHIQYEAGGGPRHVAFHDGYLYTLLELTSVVAKHRFPPAPDAPTFIASTPTMSNPQPMPNDMLAAEILIPPTNSAYPTPYLYLSNRNDPSPEGDLISIFSITNPETIELIAEIRTGLKHVRGMLFGGPDDRWLVVGGANGGGVKVFERTDGGRNLKVIAENSTVQAPTGFLWV